MQVKRVDGHKNKRLDWLPKHDAYLMENYLHLSTVTMSLELGVSTTAILNRLKELGFSKKGRYPEHVFTDEPLHPWPDVPEQGGAFYDMEPGRMYSIHVQGEPPFMGKCVEVTKHLYVVEMEKYTACFRKKDNDIQVKEHA